MRGNPFSHRDLQSVLRASLAGLAWLAGALLAPSAEAGVDPLVAGSAEAPLVLTSRVSRIDKAGNTTLGAELAGAGGARLELPLPPNGDFTSLVAVRDGWYAAGYGEDARGRRRLFVLRGDATGTPETLPAPPPSPSLVQRGAVLLTERERLVGLAWLEGDEGHALAVKAARWVDGTWRKAEVVSGPGPGSQVALAGTVLADGSWLLTWAAFDGRDDEIVWALRRTNGEWVKGGRVSAENTVPDIVPAVVALGGGALVSWSRFDGSDYRLMLARFDGERFVEERVVGGKASLYPAFQGSGDTRCLVHRDADPASEGWTVTEVDARGKLLRRAFAPSSADERPVVSLRPRGVALSWPREKALAELEWRAIP